MASALATFAAESEITVVAEGIETEAELATLISLGITTGQGYVLGRPAAAATWLGTQPRPSRGRLTIARSPEQVDLH